MPAEKRCRLHDRQRLTPVEPAREPDQGEAGGVSSTLRLHVAFLIQRQLFTEKGFFCGKGGAGTQAEAEEAQTIAHERPQQTYEPYEGTEPMREWCHRQG